MLKNASKYPGREIYSPLHLLTPYHFQDYLFLLLGALAVEELDCMVELPVTAHLLDVFMECFPNFGRDPEIEFLHYIGLILLIIRGGP